MKSAGTRARFTGRVRRERGIALPAVVFMMVVLGLMLGTGLSLLTQSQHTQTLQLQSARALAAARSAVEWGLWQVTNPATPLAPDTAPACFADQTLTLPSPLADIQVQVRCTRTPGTGQLDEGGLKRATYAIVAQASAGSPGSADYVSRKVEARHTVCRNPGGDGPDYRC